MVCRTHNSSGVKLYEVKSVGGKRRIYGVMTKKIGAGCGARGGGGVGGGTVIKNRYALSQV